jgi:hypothetical protein
LCTSSHTSGSADIESVPTYTADASQFGAQVGMTLVDGEPLEPAAPSAPAVPRARSVAWRWCVLAWRGVGPHARHRIRVRTTNLAERSFVEERRRTKVIPD